MRLDRRQLLKTLVAGALGATSAAAAASGLARHRTSELAAAVARAESAGRPLLVVLIPDEAERFTRGQDLGAALNHGDDELFAALSLVDLFCATPEEVHALKAGHVADEAWFALVETDKRAVTGRAIALPKPPNDPSCLVGRRRPEVRCGRTIDEWVDDKIAVISRGLRALILPDAATLARRVTQSRRVLSLAQQSRYEVALEGGVVSAELAEHAPALVADRIARHGDQGEYAQLAAHTRARILNTRVSGSHWASSHGCGVVVEEVEQNWAIGCGMGHVPQKSTRLLYFWDPSEPR